MRATSPGTLLLVAVLLASLPAARAAVVVDADVHVQGTLPPGAPPVRQAARVELDREASVWLDPASLAARDGSVALAALGSQTEIPVGSLVVSEEVNLDGGAALGSVFDAAHERSRRFVTNAAGTFAAATDLAEDGAEQRCQELRAQGASACEQSVTVLLDAVDWEGLLCGDSVKFPHGFRPPPDDPDECWWLVLDDAFGGCEAGVQPWFCVPHDDGKPGGKHLEHGVLRWAIEQLRWLRDEGITISSEHVFWMFDLVRWGARVGPSLSVPLSSAAPWPFPAAQRGVYVTVDAPGPLAAAQYVDPGDALGSLPRVGAGFALDGVGVHVDLRPEDGGAQSSSPADEPDGANRAAKAYGLSGPGPASAVGPQSGVMAALLLGVALAIPLWALYRRLVREGALDQERRRRIHDLVLASPGITAGELRSATGLHYTTVTHHLRVLHELGLVEVLRLDGRLRAFENHGRFGCVEKRVAAAAKSATSLAVLTVALRRPGVSPSTVATELGLTRPAVKRHVDKLAAWGLLEPRREGARLRLHLSPRAVDAVLARQPSVRAP